MDERLRDIAQAVVEHRAGEHGITYFTCGVEFDDHIMALSNAVGAALAASDPATAPPTDVDADYRALNDRIPRVAQDSPDPLREALETLARACRDDEGTCRLCGAAISMFHENGCPVEAAIRVLEPAYRAAIEGVSRDPR